MAGVTITVDDKPVLEALEALVARTGDLTPAFRDVGEHLLRTTRERFDTQTGPDGKPWAPLSPRYKEQKKKNKNKILTLHGYLRSTLAYQIEDDGTTLAVGSPMIYAGTMQFGAAQGQFGRYSQVSRWHKYKKGDFRKYAGTKKGFPIPWGNIPARPFLGLSADDEQEVLAILQEHLGAF